MDAKSLTIAREMLGLKQADLARELGVTSVTVWRWEHGRKRIPAWVGQSLDRMTELRVIREAAKVN